MLVLSRHRNEGIIINKNIKITVVDIESDKIRLGITAPVEIPVHRKEVYERIKKSDFMFCLQSGKYEDAYNELLKEGYKPASNELSELKEGLRKMGKLDKSIEDKLNIY